MVEPAATTPSVAAGQDRDALLATKLYIPRARAGLVPRPRLLERLAGGAGHQVVLICTPAGFGKTTLLADWARAGQGPVAWLSLDAGDNDPARFWRHAVAALDAPLQPLPGGFVDRQPVAAAAERLPHDVAAEERDFVAVPDAADRRDRLAVELPDEEPLGIGGMERLRIVGAPGSSPPRPSTGR